MRKPKKQKLTPDLINELSQGAYCFDQEHENAIKDLRKEVDTKVKEAQKATREAEEKAAAKMAEYQTKLKDLDDEIFTRDEEIAKLREELDGAYATINDLKEKQLAKEEAKKNRLPSVSPDSLRFDMTQTEFLTFAAMIATSGKYSGEVVENLFTVFCGKSFRQVANDAVAAVRQAREAPPLIGNADQTPPPRKDNLDQFMMEWLWKNRGPFKPPF